MPSLGNLNDPVQEIFYIVLSAKTTDAQYRRTHAELAAKFRDLAALARARLKAIVRCIAGGGLANKKARQVKRIAARLIADLGDDPAASLRRMSAREAFDYLTALPGLGPKSALCVMMCSLNFDVFPVDVNVSRIANRVGVVRRGLKHYEYTQRIPAAIPEGRSKQLHVGLVVHGRTICLPRKPRCESCFISDCCNYGKRRLRGTSDGGNREKKS
jgi:endonuclease III